MRQVMLTTTDNPYDPYIQFDDWFAFDRQMGYFTCEYLGRLAYISPDLSAAEQQIAVETAIDSIIENDIFGIYKKVVKYT